MVNQEVLDRLRKAREKKAPKEKQPIKRGSPLPKSSRPPAKRSEKMKGVMAALKLLYDKFLGARPNCEIRSPVCTGEATCVHHIQGRGIKVILDDVRWKASCDPCNSYVEANDKQARENGHKISRLKKDNQ